METHPTIGNSLADKLARRTRQLARRARQLRESEARFRNIIERNADAIIVIDASGLVQFANREAGKLFGSKPEELLGTTFGFPLVAGETTELDLLRPGGTRMVEMRVVESQWEGKRACIATLRDVTERNLQEKNARRLIREQVARSTAEDALHRFRFLAESSVVLSTSLDLQKTMAELTRLCVVELADWAVVYMVDEANLPRRIEVAHRDPALAGLAQQLRDSEVDAAASNPVLETMRTRRPTLVSQVNPEQLSAMIRTADQRDLVRQLGLTSFMVVPMVARDRTLGALALVSASTERVYNDSDLALASDLATRAALAIDNVRLYQEAREANQTKSELLGVISHDLRTPLNSVIGYVQLLEMGLPEPLPDSCRERVGRIRLSAQHLLYLIDQLLAFARLESGHDEVRLRAVDLNLLIQEVGSLIEPLASERGLKLCLRSASEMLLRTDPDKLRQILVNLTANAVKYTTAGEVSLAGATKPDGSAVIKVSDTGIGIAPEDLPHIFEPFWQVDRSQRARGGGTGLGLSVVRRVCDQLGGTIDVTSAPGRGSTFTVTLPAG